MLSNALMKRNNALMKRNNALMKRNNALVKRNNVLAKRNNKLRKHKYALNRKLLIVKPPKPKPPPCALKLPAYVAPLPHNQQPLIIDQGESNRAKPHQPRH